MGPGKLMKLSNPGTFIFFLSLVMTIASLVSSYLNLLPSHITDGLVLVAAAIGGFPIVLGAIRAILSKNFNVDFLASIAIIASIIVREYIAAAIVVIMLTGGEMLEDYGSGKATTAIEKLIRSVPKKARIRRNESEIEVPIEEVHLGDIVIVKPGEKIPVDGLVIGGTAAVNQATITGESMPVEKAKGDEVFGNTFVELGALEIKVTKIGEDTTFAHVIKLVREAQARKAPIERVADRYARWFTPIILMLAVSAFFVTGDALRVISVLVIACPCALTIATPTAVIASIGNAAKKGILIRGGTILEKAAKVDIVVIDKTGTLTTGDPKVVTIEGVNGRTETEALFLAAVAERYSEHPLAKAVLKKANALGIEVADPSEFRVIPGYGVVAKHNSREIIVGNRRLLENNGIKIDKATENYLRALEEDGKTVLLIAEGQELAGIIGVADTLRRKIPQAIENMREVGIKKTVMLTGDTSQIAQSIAKQAGVDEVKSGLLPEDKVAYVEKFRVTHKVAMVGDGINDAPALASADIGIAMGAAGTDIAIETAGIILTTDEIGKVPEAIGLSRRTLTVIKQNILFALVVNILGIALSTMGIVSPILASAIHEGNALLVVLNSVRLIRAK
jgi:Cd2+/Zn2+-exporting ATPase